MEVISDRCEVFASLERPGERYKAFVRWELL